MKNWKLTIPNLLKLLRVKKHFGILALVLVFIISGGYITYAKTEGLYPFLKNNPTVGTSTEKQPTLITSPDPTATATKTNPPPIQPKTQSNNTQPTQSNQLNPSPPPLPKPTEKICDSNMQEAKRNVENASYNLWIFNEITSYNNQMQSLQSELGGILEDLNSRGLERSGAVDYYKNLYAQKEIQLTQQHDATINLLRQIHNANLITINSTCY